MILQYPKSETISSLISRYRYIALTSGLTFEGYLFGFIKLFSSAHLSAKPDSKALSLSKASFQYCSWYSGSVERAFCVWKPHCALIQNNGDPVWVNEAEFGMCMCVFALSPHSSCEVHTSFSFITRVLSTWANWVRGRQRQQYITGLSVGNWGSTPSGRKTLRVDRC